VALDAAVSENGRKRRVLPGRPELNRILVRFAHTPLDKYSLLEIRRDFYGIVISKNPSMGDIDSIETYEFLQRQIQSLMSDASLPALFFDYLAWNKRPEPVST